MKKACLFLLLGFISRVFAYSDWVTVGQGGGGAIVDVVCHPADSNIVWVLTDLTGIFKSSDDGKTYDRMSGPIEKEEQLFEWMRGVAYELAYDPSDPNIMYWAMDGGIYTVPGLYKSVDGGETWFKIPGSPDLAPGAIVVDNNGIIYGVKHQKLYISTDKGDTWHTKPDVPTYYCDDDYMWRRKFRIIIYTTKDNRIFIGDRRDGTGIYYTVDMGDSWIQALEGEEIMDIGSSPITPGLVMALEQDGRIFRSDNGGESFETIDSLSHGHYRWGQWPPYYGSIAINGHNRVIAIGRREMGISFDAGISFKKIKEEDCQWDPGDFIFPNRQTTDAFLKCSKLSASPVSKHWYFVDGMVVKTSKDNGKSWIGRCNGIDIICIYSPPVIDKTNPDIIHIAAGDVGHHYTIDGGKTWYSSETGMGSVDGVTQDPNNPSVYYKMYGRGRKRGIVHKSSDSGMTWKKVGQVPVPRGKRGGRSGFQGPLFYHGWLGQIRVDPTNSDRIYACHRMMDGVYMSENGGCDYERIIELVRPWQLEVTKNGTVFVCTWDSKGLYRSTDNGKEFKMIHNGMVHDFAVHPNNENIVYLNAGSFSHAWSSARKITNYERERDHGSGGKGKLYKTTDGGKTWTILGQYDGFAIYIEPNFPSYMLMSTRDGGQGIMRSSDSGVTWHSIHNLHDNYHPRGFIYGGVPGRVYTWNHNIARIDNIHINGLSVIQH
jgi:photosystem II stability/assembly factor-like uncharacterized protein